MQSDPSIFILKIVMIIFLLSFKFLITLMNTAIDTVNRKTITNLASKEESEKAILLVSYLEKPSKYMYTNIFISMTTTIISLYLLLDVIKINELIVIISYIAFICVITEIFPRKISLSHREKISLNLIKFQHYLCIVFKPINILILVLSNIMLGIFRQDIDVDDDDFSEDMVMSLLESGQESGVIKEEGKNMINSIFAFDDELAYEVMTPRTDVFVIDIKDPIEEYLDQLMELQYSRIPVCEDETDNIIGILHIKDFLIKARFDGFNNVDIKSILRKPYFVPDTKNIDSLFYELQKSRQHIAILIDEYGGFSGIVTMEDIIEEVMGDIDDEYDEEQVSIEKISDDTYIVGGNTSLDDVDEELNIDLKSDISETIGGFIIDILGEIPGEDDIDRIVEYNNYQFKILSINERRIDKIQLKILLDDTLVEKNNEEL